MQVLDFMLGTHAATIQQLGHPAAGVIGWLGGNAATSGVEVNENTLLNYSAAWCATRVICETQARLPLLVYERQAGGGKVRVDTHPLYRLLHDSPNSTQTSMTFREVMTERALNSGRAYAEIERNGAGVPIALHPIHPSRVHRQKDGSYLVATSKGPVPLTASDVFELVGPLGGKGVIPHGIESIGMGLATERHGAAFFGNGAKPAFVLKHPRVLGDEARTNLRKEWNDTYGGTENAGKVGILWEGVEIQELTINNEQAQYLQTRQHNLTEIARWYNITPHKLHDLARATFSNVEHLQIDFVMHTISPWLIRWEQAIQLQLFDEGDRDKYFAEHLIDGLLRSDITSRYNAYAVGLLNGWFTINDVLRLENMNPIGPEGDVHRVPLNQAPVGQEQPDQQGKAMEEVRALVGQAIEGSQQSASTLARMIAEHERASANRGTGFTAGINGLSDLAARLTTDATVAAEPYKAKLDAILEKQSAEEQQRASDLCSAAQAVVTDTMSRVLTKEANAATRAAGKPGEFLAWLDTFYTEHQAFVVEAIRRPVAVLLLATADPRAAAEVVPGIAAEHCERSKAELLAAADGNPDAFVDRVTACVGGWHTTRSVLSLGGDTHVAT